MARVLGYGVGNTNGARSFAGKTPAVDTGSVNFFSMAKRHPFMGQLGMWVLVAVRVAFP